MMSAMKDVPVVLTLYRDGVTTPMYRLYQALSVAVPGPPLPLNFGSGPLSGWPAAYYYTVEAAGMEPLTLRCGPEMDGYNLPDWYVQHREFLEQLHAVV